MSVFWSIFFKLISVLSNVVIGYIGGKIKKIDINSIASLLFYLIAPIIFFSVPASTKLNFNTISIVIIVAIISSISCLISYYILGFYSYLSGFRFPYLPAYYCCLCRCIPTISFHCHHIKIICCSVEPAQPMSVTFLLGAA